MPTEWRSPTDLYQRFCAGDSKTIDHLYDFLYRVVSGAYRNSLSSADWEDVTQNTLIAAMDTAEQLREPERLIGWIKRIALNKAYHASQDRKKVMRSNEDDDNFSQDDFIEQALWDISLNQEFVKLTGNEREAFMLTKIQGLSHAEASEKTGRTKESIAQASSGACRKLRAALGDHRVGR